MVKTAGMVHGTPDWQLDRMYETETEKRLEEIYNSDDDFPASEVAADLNTADYHIGQALGKLCHAGDVADKFGRAKEIDEWIEMLENFRIDLSGYRQKLEGRKC